MKKHIDKSCLQGNNVITLIKRFIKHKIKQYKKEETIMLQQVMTNPGEIIFREVPVPEVKENQVLVKIMNIGVCGSDIHVYHGKHPFTKYPVTQGHEVSGEITELGKNHRVSCWTEGDDRAAGILWTLLSMPSWKV